MPEWGPQSSSAALFGSLLLVGGLLGLWAIGREVALLIQLRREGITTTGTVVRHVRGTRGVDSQVLQFTDQDGQQVQFTPKRALLTKFVANGEQFSVRYLAGQPHRARLVHEETGSGLLLVFLLVCLVSAVSGLLLLAGMSPPRSHGLSAHFGRADQKLVIVVVAALAAMLLLAFCAHHIRTVLVMRRHGITTTGTVIRVSTRGVGSDHGGGQTAVVEFLDTNRRQIQFATNNGSCSLGGKVPVAYWPDRPESARIASVSRTAYSMSVGAMLLIGIILCLLFLA